MLNGDISNKVSPRILLVFEGALGYCTDKAKHDKLVRKKRYAQAIKLWQLHDLAVSKILWLFHRRDITIEVVTFLGDEFVAGLLSWLDDSDIPVHRVWASTPEKLGRTIAYMPDLACVYDPEPQRWLMYGKKGVFLHDINQLGDFLR